MEFDGPSQENWSLGGMLLFNAFCRLAAFLSAAVLSGQVSAEPISIRGVNWAMSKAEQVAALEGQGLSCVNEVGWNATIGPPQRDRLEELQPETLCFQSNKEITGQLRASFEDWVNLCERSNDDCFGYRKNFTELRDSLKRVNFDDEKMAIIFDCSFVGTCGFDQRTVVGQLQKKVINKVFTQPTQNSYVICADGDDGDSICVHGYSRAIWLLKNPLKENMKF